MPASLCLARSTRAGGCSLEAVTPADRRHLEVQWSVSGMATLVHEVRWTIMTDSNVHQLFVARVRLAEVSAQAALSVVNLFHPSSWP